MSGGRVGIVQARSGSTRLPGKVLRELGGRPMLLQQLLRLQQCEQLDQIVLATTTAPADDPVEAVAREAGVQVFRGSEEDVLDRLLRAARQTDAEVVVRLTGDCPLTDPQVVDSVIRTLLEGATEFDYASNTLVRTYPRGLDAEALFRDTLERVGRRARSRAAREHVTYYIVRERPDLFSTASVEAPEDNSDLRWTVDTEEDLELVSQLYRELDLSDTGPVPYTRLVRHVRSRPELFRINASVEQRFP